MHCSKTQLSNSRGFSLIEVLIALVVLSVGLLGLAAMQAEGLRTTSVAQQRYQAVRLAGDIADRMRANIAGATDDDYVIAAGASAAGGASSNCSDSVSGGSASDASNCTSAQMAAYDLFLWRDDLQTYLPSGTGSVTRLSALRYSITVTWSKRTSNSPGQQPTIITEVQL